MPRRLYWLGGLERTRRLELFSEASLPSSSNCRWIQRNGRKQRAAVGYADMSASADTAGVEMDPEQSSRPHPLGPEQRREPRFEVLVDIQGRAASQRVRLANISDSGCLVYANGQLLEGVIYTFQFYVAPHLGQVRVSVKLPKQFCGLQRTHGGNLGQIAFA